MSGTVVVRRIIATPVRQASEAWSVIVSLFAPQKDSDARKELESIAGIVCSLIADEALKDAPAVIYGSGPRVRVYCLYDEEAISGDDKSENALSFTPTEGDWRLSLPCLPEDLDWVTSALKAKSSRITARDYSTSVPDEDEGDEGRSMKIIVNREVFLRS